MAYFVERLIKGNISTSTNTLSDISQVFCLHNYGEAYDHYELPNLFLLSENIFGCFCPRDAAAIEPNHSRAPTVVLGIIVKEFAWVHCSCKE
jgi:hypothetical protein